MKKKYLSLLPMVALVGCGTNAGGVNTHVIVPTNGTVVEEEERDSYALALAEGITYIGTNSFIASSEISLSADVSQTMEGESIKGKIDLKAHTILAVDYLTVGIFEEYVIPSIALYVEIESLKVDVNYVGQKISANVENLLVSAQLDAANKYVYVDLSGYGDEEFSISASIGGETLIDTATVQALINEYVGDGLLYLDLNTLMEPAGEVGETINIFEQVFGMAGMLFASIVEEENFDVYKYNDGGVAASIDLKGEVEEGVNVQAGLMVLVNEDAEGVASLEEVKTSIYVNANVSDEGMNITSSILANVDCGFQYDDELVSSLMLGSDEKLEFTTNILDLVNTVE